MSVEFKLFHRQDDEYEYERELSSNNYAVLLESLHHKHIDLGKLIVFFKLILKIANNSRVVF